MHARSETDRAPAPPGTAPSLPPLPLRALQLFYAPGALFERLRERPVWGTALVLGAAVFVASFFLIPVELWQQTFREQMLRSGRPVPENLQLGNVARIWGAVAGGSFWFFHAFFLSGLITLIFRFFLGDEGRYKQYLSVVSHALLIPALGALLLVPLKIAQGDAQLTLNVGLFVPAEGESYPFRVLRLLDLFMLWSYAVVGIGLSKIDPRRSWGSATAFLITLAVGMALVLGIFSPPV